MKTITRLFCIVFLWYYVCFAVSAGNVYYIGDSSKYDYLPTDFPSIPVGGDTVKILAERTTKLRFKNLNGSEGNPIVFINSGGRVLLRTIGYTPLTFENCTNIKISGKGDKNHHYGFRLVGGSGFGLSFSELSSSCEAEFLEIDSCSLGIHAKKDFWYNPPVPYPVFKNLAIHDNYIHDCCEAMYIGETKSPGMEFRHLRIYNNVIMNSGRESFQIANSVEDVEVYNNFCYNSGRDSIYAQSNNGQLGGNSVGKFYNNIFIKSPAFGCIILGIGDMHISNNYFEDNGGCFADSRYYPILDSPLKITDNYFKSVKGNQVLMIYNSVNDIYVSGNRWETNLPLLNYGKNPSTFYDYSNNVKCPVDSFRYVIENGIFRNFEENPIQYRNMGPLQGLTHSFNATPSLDTIPDIIVNIGDLVDIPIRASVTDGDSLFFSMKNKPSFVTLVHGNNGNAVLRIDARNCQKSVQYAVVSVSDKSNAATDRQKVKIAIKNADNQPVTMNLPSRVSMEAASKMTFRLPAYDPDGDSIRYTVSGLTYFMSTQFSPDSACLIFKPTAINTGSFQIIVKAEDGYSCAVIDTIDLIVGAPVLTPGRILYRVNYGNAEVNDTPINWLKDYGDYRSCQAGYSMATGSATWSGINNTGAKNNVFGPFRYNGVGMQDMCFEYPCQPGAYTVNLFFAERSVEVNNGIDGTFGVMMEDSLMQDSINIYKEASYSALKKSYVVHVRDNGLSLRLMKRINMAKLNGVEIIYKESINIAPAIGDLPAYSMKEGDTLSIMPAISDDSFPGTDSVDVVLLEAPSFVSLQKSNLGYRLTSMPDYSSSGVYNISIKASDGQLSSLKTFNLTVTDFHITPPLFDSVSKIEFTEGVRDTTTISFVDPDNDAMTISVVNMPSFCQFSTLSNGVGRFILTPGFYDAGEYSIQVKVIDSFGFSVTKELFITVLDGYEIVRIPLNAGMITDLGGSYFSSVPSQWVNEQNLDPLLNQHPVSDSWKANANAIPCQFYLNLGNKYVIKKMYFHDSYNIGKMYVSTGDPVEWTDLFSFSTDQYNSWRAFDTNISTQYLRFSIRESASCPQINELAIYGYLDPSSTPQMRSASWNSTVQPVDDREELATSRLKWNSESQALIATTLERNYKIEIYSVSGVLALRSLEQSTDLSFLNKGIYLARMVGVKGDEICQLKFIKL